MCRKGFLCLYTEGLREHQEFCRSSIDGVLAVCLSVLLCMLCVPLWGLSVDSLCGVSLCVTAYAASLCG